MAEQTPSARVVQVNVNPAGGVPKQRTPSAEVSSKGVAGDKQRDRRHHGGPTRAVSLYSYEHIQALRAEGHPAFVSGAGPTVLVLTDGSREGDVAARAPAGWVVHTLAIGAEGASVTLV